jgi:hypothetical protein
MDNEEILVNTQKHDIYKYVNLSEIRKLLISFPQLCALFELLCMHINTIININNNKDRLNRSLPC